MFQFLYFFMYLCTFCVSFILLFTIYSSLFFISLLILNVFIYVLNDSTIFRMIN